MGSVTDLAEAVRTRLLDSGGDALLPPLTREELIVLGDDPVLRHSHDELWWEGLDEGRRDLVREVALRALVARGLLVPDAEGDLEIDVEARIVLQARRGPSTVLVAREPAEQPGGALPDGDAPRPELAVLGVDLAEGVRSGYVVSTYVSSILSARLVSPETAGRLLTGWLLRPAPEGREVVGRTLEVLRPQSGGDGVETARAMLVTDGSVVHVSEVTAEGTPAAPAQLDGAALYAWVERQLAAYASAPAAEGAAGRAAGPVTGGTGPGND